MIGIESAWINRPPLVMRTSLCSDRPEAEDRNALPSPIGPPVKREG
jgi:hypothetical protein